MLVAYVNNTKYAIFEAGNALLIAVEFLSIPSAFSLLAITHAIMHHVRTGHLIYALKGRTAQNQQNYLCIVGCTQNLELSLTHSLFVEKNLFNI